MTSILPRNHGPRAESPRCFVVLRASTRIPCLDTSPGGPPRRRPPIANEARKFPPPAIANRPSRKSPGRETPAVNPQTKALCSMPSALNRARRILVLAAWPLLFLGATFKQCLTCGAGAALLSPLVVAGFRLWFGPGG